jgi:hypothetical protein
MGCVPALRAAMNLLHFPSQAALIRAGPLPEGVVILLRIAAGDAEVTTEASTSVGRSRETVREAAAFFLEQVLLHSDSDSYRVLGVTREASYPELRRNMSLLLQWLHPDIERRELRSVLATRVTRAWNDLKTRDRRAAYDQAQYLALAEKSSLRTRGPTRTSYKKPLTRGSVNNRAQYRRYAGLHQLRQPRLGFWRKWLLLLFGRSA